MRPVRGSQPIAAMLSLSTQPIIAACRASCIRGSKRQRTVDRPTFSTWSVDRELCVGTWLDGCSNHRLPRVPYWTKQPTAATICTKHLNVRRLKSMLGRWSSTRPERRRALCKALYVGHHDHSVADAMIRNVTVELRKVTACY